MIKAAIFDIDGTLTSPLTHELVPSAIKACQQLKAKGVKIIIATGRQVDYTSMLDGYISPDYYVSCSGALLTDGHKKPFEYHQIAAKDYDDINDYVVENDLSLFWKYVDGCYVYHKKGGVNELEVFLATLPKKQFKANEKIAVSGAIVLDEKQAAHFQETFKGRFNFTPGGFGLYDVEVCGVDKLSGLKKVLAKEDVDLNECIGFGDSENDLPIIANVGIGVAMASGSEKLKQSATYICEAPDEDGIYKTLLKYQIIDK